MIILLATLISGAVAASAQDIVTRKDGSEIRAKVTAVGTDTITYTLYDESDGVEYTIMKSEVVLIKYESGRNEVIKATAGQYDPLLYGYREPVQGIKPGMKYREYKHLYNPKEYTRGLVQTHNPAGVGVASYFIPGLGQMICGEGWRGVGFLGGSCLGYGIMIGGAVHSYNYNAEPFIWGGLAIMLTSQIWSIIDAVQVAKIKNMYERDLMRTYSLEVDLYPSLDCVKTASGLQPTAGLTLAMRF